MALFHTLITNTYVRRNYKETTQPISQCTQESKVMGQNFYAFSAAKYGEISGADVADVANRQSL